MWLLPRSCNITVFWSVVKDSPYFQLLKYKGGLLMGVISTVRSLNPLDSNPQPFRIVLKAGAENLLVAVADTLDDMNKHWEKLETELLPLAQDIEEAETIIQFFTAKIGGWATLEEGEEGNNSVKVQAFHNLFHERVKDEKLLTYYDGAVWRKGKPPIPACLYITEHFVCIDSNEKLVFQFKDILSITKDATLPLISNGIIKFQVRSADPQTPEAFWFMLFKQANKAHATLESVWTANLNHWQSELASASEANNSFTKKPATPVASSSAPGSPARTVLASKNTALLNRSNALQEFSAEFLVPEEPVTKYAAVTLAGLPTHAPVLVGTLTLTNSFVCWSSNTNINVQKIRVVIAANSIMNVTAAGLMGINTYIVIETDEGNKFTFLSVHPNQLKADIDQMRERHTTYFNRMDQRRNMPTSRLQRNGYQMDIDRETNLDHQETQARLQGHWEQYFKNYGRGTSMIIVVDEIRRLLRMGIPDIYRPELWPLLCGASHKMNANPGQYVEYLSTAGLRQTTAAGEIDKDLHRSMPSHPYYSNQPKNLEPLRNVLLAYAARNPVLGYCQGMNIVAAMLLLYLPEEVAFWVLTSLVEEIAPDYYNKQLFGSQVDQKVFNRLVKRRYPELYSHLKEVGMPLHLLSLPWFMTFMIDAVPWDASLIVIDNLLNTGTSVLFQVALAMLTATYDLIMAEKTENEQIPIMIAKYPFESFELMKVAFDKFNYIDPESVRRMRREGKAARLNDMQQEAHKQTLLRVKRKFKTTWKEDQIEEANRHYLGQSKNDLLSFEDFKQILFTYAPYIEKNADKPPPTPESSNAPPPADSASTPPEATASAPPSVNLSSSQPDCLITPASEVITAPPPEPEPAADEVLQSRVLSVQFQDETLRAIYKSQAIATGGVDFLGLVVILDSILNKTPSQLFTWLAGIFYPNAQNAGLVRLHFERLTFSLYVVNYAGEAPIESNVARIQQFVALVFEQLCGNITTITDEQLQDVVLGSELLESFWSRLYFLEGTPTTEETPTPKPAGEQDLISFS